MRVGHSLVPGKLLNLSSRVGGRLASFLIGEVISITDRLASANFRKIAGPRYFELAAQYSVPKLQIKGDRYTIVVDPCDLAGRLHGLAYFTDRKTIHEPYERSLFEQSIAANPGSVVVDVGASYGHFTLDTCVNFGTDHVSSLIAIEPDTRVFSCLTQSLEKNAFAGRVVAINAAVSDQHNCDLTFYREASCSEWSKIQHFGAHSESYLVRGVTLDGVLAELDIDAASRFIVKMDIEGAEARALDGMREMLALCSGYQIFTEFIPLVMKGYGTDPNRFAQQICELNPDITLEIHEDANALELVEGRSGWQKMVDRCLAGQDWPERFTNIFLSKNMNLGASMQGKQGQENASKGLPGWG